jgi:hypothetical protein
MFIMGNLPIEIEYDDGGYFTGKIRLSVEPIPNGGGIAIPDYKELPPGSIIWKQKGTTDHPRIENGLITASAFVLGHFAHVEVKIHFGKETYLGGNQASEAFWYFQLPADLMPDFNDPKTMEATGSFHAYRSGEQMMDGSSYWTRNVGSGIDGIKLSANMRYDIGPKSCTWACRSLANGLPDGDSLRFSINYRRGSDVT